MTHLEQRLADRNIQMTQSQLCLMAATCQKDTAIILSKGTFKGVNSGDFYGRMTSNGELVVLIVREHKPVTIMYRRANQGMRPTDLRVSVVLDATLYKKDR